MPRPSKKSRKVHFTRSVAARTVKNRKSRLLNLLAELRNQIYSYALAAPDIIDLAKRFEGAPQLLSIYNFYGHDYVLPVVELDPNAYRWLMSLPPAVIRIFNLTFDDWVRSQNGMHECCVTIQVRPHTAHVDVSLAGVEFVSSRSPILTPHFSPYHELTPQMRAMFAERGVELERAVRSMMAFRDQGKGLSLTEINGILVHCDRFG
ncbi:hypothetical protein LTR28_008026 [Elasticomyces elasticus]|nr:hypothetical protein LTR28_008026 [Elasticomyces elasticus]